MNKNHTYSAILIFHLVIFFTFAGANSQAQEIFTTKKLVISDIDDTIKYSNITGSKREVIYNALFNKSAFSGMSELYREFGSDPELMIYYISGSPKDLRSKVYDFLTHNQYPYPEKLILRQSLFDDIEAYKIESITNLINRINPDKIILIGDDTEKDPEIYQEIKNRFPEKIKSIYIHLVLNRKLPSIDEMKGYFSSVEIAGDQLITKDLLQEENSLIKVAKGFNERSFESAIFIKDKYCPKDGRDLLKTLPQYVNTPDAKTSIIEAQENIIKACSK